MSTLTGSRCRLSTNGRLAGLRILERVSKKKPHYDWVLGFDGSERWEALDNQNPCVMRFSHGSPFQGGLIFISDRCEISMGTNGSASPKLDIMSILKSDIDVVFGEGGVYTTESHAAGILLYPPPAIRLLRFWQKKTPRILGPGGH